MWLDLIHSVWISMLFEFLCRLVSHPFCLGLYVVRVSISLALFTVLHGSLFCPIFYVTWCHLRSVLVFMLSEFLCHLVSLPFCMGLYVVRVSMSLVSLPLCMVLYVFQVSMSLNLTAVLYGSLCCPGFYVTWSLFRYVWVSILSDFLCHLISLPFCMYFHVVRVYKSLALTFVLYGSLCCPSFCIGFLSSLCSSLC